jgi:hypothetical protein
MPNRVPFEVITTGQEVLDRIQNNAAQAIRQLQEQIQPLQSLETDQSVMLGKVAVLTVTPEAIKSVTVSLPMPPPSNQTSRIVNNSNYAVKLMTSDATTVFAAIERSSSATVTANGKVWTRG